MTKAGAPVKDVFLSIIEEFWPGQAEDMVVARVEVTGPTDDYPSEEIRIRCKYGEEWRTFRNKYDFVYVSAEELDKLREEAKRLIY